MRALWVVLLLSSPPARADDKLEDKAETLGFVEVFKAATRTAPTLEHIGFDIARSDASVLSARAQEALTLRMDGSFNRTLGAPVAPSTEGNLTDVLSLNTTLSRQLPTNGTLELTGSTSKTVSDFSGMSKTLVTTSFKMRFNQPLLKGFGPAAQRQNIRRAEHSRDAAMLKARGTANEFSGTLADVYWKLALAWRVLEVRRAGYELVLKQRKLTEAAMKSGKVAPNELIPVDAALAGSEQDVLAAELDVISRSLDLRKEAGLEVPIDRIAIKTDALPDVDKDPIDLETYVKDAIANSFTLAAARSTALAADAAYSGSKRELLPKLDLRIEGGPLGTDSSFLKSIDQLKTRDGYSLSAALNFELPLGREGARGAHLEDRATRASARHELIEEQTNLTAQVARGVYEVRTHRAKAAVAVKAIAFAQANVDAEQKKFELGKSTNNEIVRLQDELESARLRHATTLADYAIARAKLDALTGIFLDRIGIKVKVGGYNLDVFTHGAQHHEHDGHDH